MYMYVELSEYTRGRVYGKCVFNIHVANQVIFNGLTNCTWRASNTCTLPSERQKIQVSTSLERHSLKSKSLKRLIIGHRLALNTCSTPYFIKHISRSKRLLESTRSKMQWNRKRSLFKNHRGTEFGMDKCQYGGYIKPAIEIVFEWIGIEFWI